VTVDVPAGTPPNSIDAVTLRFTSGSTIMDEEAIVLRSIAPVATEPTSFGKLKALYRKKSRGGE
jgi:hypothetical protein